MKEEILEFDEMLSILKPIIFGFENMLEKKVLLNELHVGMNASFHDSEKNIMEVAEAMGKIEIAKQRFSGEEREKRIREFKNNIPRAVEDTFKPFSIKKNGFCLKSNLIGCAVQMRTNSDMLGFITRVDDVRFVFVDFGGTEPEVKIDIDELILSEKFAK
jgi:hypothetical protein